MIQLADNPKTISLDGCLLRPLTDAERATVAENMGLIGLWLYVKPQRWAMAFVERWGGDEYHSLGHSVLIRCVQRHDPAKGKLSTFFANVFRREVARYRTLAGRRMQDLEVFDGRYIDGRPMHEIPVEDSGLTDADAADAARYARGLANNLPPAELEVIRLRFWEGRKFREIARALGISVQRASQIASAALARMRKEVAA